MNPPRKTSWSPWAGGAAIGVLSWFAFATAGRGITSPFESTMALAERTLAPSFAGLTCGRAFCRGADRPRSAAAMSPPSGDH